MTDKELYIELKEAYTEENLNRISSQIIYLYKTKQYKYIRELMNKISHIISFREEKINRIFTKLIMLYHPDKLNYYIREIEKYTGNGNETDLHKLSHILIIQNEIKKEEFEYVLEEEAVFPDTGWGYDEEDFDRIKNIDDEDFEESEEDIIRLDEDIFSPGRDFFTAFKLKEYGDLDAIIELYHLQSIEGSLELQDYDISDLTGINYCKYVTILDLSNNNIHDISLLTQLKRIEELYLTNNNLTDIFALHKLQNLRTLDISGNDITDLRPVFHLIKLEYINIIGNDIPREQTDILEEKGVVVVY